MSDDIMEKCTEECLGLAEDSKDQGRKCGRSFRLMMACVGTLDSCDEMVLWATRSPDSACVSESVSFDSACEDLGER